MQPFPALGRREKLSTGGGAEPIWSPKGDELFFRAGRKVMVVPVRLEPDGRAVDHEVVAEGVVDLPAEHLPDEGAPRGDGGAK